MKRDAAKGLDQGRSALFRLRCSRRLQFKFYSVSRGGYREQGRQLDDISSLIAMGGDRFPSHLFSVIDFNGNHGGEWSQAEYKTLQPSLRWALNSTQLVDTDRVHKPHLPS